MKQLEKFYFLVWAAALQLLTFLLPKFSLHSTNFICLVSTILQFQREAQSDFICGLGEGGIGEKWHCIIHHYTCSREPENSPLGVWYLGSAVLPSGNQETWQVPALCSPQFLAPVWAHCSSPHISIIILEEKQKTNKKLNNKKTPNKLEKNY